MSAAPRRAAILLALALSAVVLLRGPCAPRPTRVVLVGDSITVGIVSEPKGPSYAELLAQQLGHGFQIVNVACGGSSTLDWQPDARPALCPGVPGWIPLYATRARPALPADIATILLGTNDMRGALEQAPIEPAAYQAALRALATALHADGAREVLLISPPFSLGGVVRLAGYRPRIRELCQELRFVTCGPDLVEVLHGDDFAPGDVHPNASGHAKIADALAAALRELESR